MNGSASLPVRRESYSDSFALLVEELTARLQAGESLDLEAFLATHPEDGEELRRLLPALVLLADVSHSGDGPDFGVALGDGREELGDFRLVREVGRGGMGVVYEAEQISLGRRVALKVLPFAATMDAKHLQRFHNEARAAACLHHEHIIPVYFVGCERGVHFYAMQYIDGQTLAEGIAALRGQDAQTPGGPHAAANQPTRPAAALTTERLGPGGRAFYRQAAALIAQAADALEHAHSLGIIHRDVKPGNLLLDREGKLWVGDFGLARTGPDAGLTVSGDLVGTLRYMSPEQALARHGLVDHRTDIYALGATLYELLTLQPAVAGQDRQEVLRRIAFDEPTAPRRLDRSIPPELETITLKALAKVPGERFATAEEMAADLRRWLAGEPIKARRVGPAERLRRWVRRQPALAALLAVTALSTVALVAGLLWHNAGLQAEAARTARERDTAREEQRWASQAVDDMYTQVAQQWLGTQPRLQQLQKEFLEKALAYYVHAATHAGDDPAARRKLALSHLRVGVINLTLGHLDPAESGLRQAVALLEPLAAEDAADAVVRSDLVVALSRLGETLSIKGQQADAAEAHRRQLEISQRLAADFPDRADLQRYPASARANLALDLDRSGRRQEAESTYRQALDEISRLPATCREQSITRFVTANTANLLANLYHETGRYPEAEPLYRQAITGFEALGKEFPANTQYRESHGYSLSNLAAVLDNCKRPQEGRPLLLQAEAVLERLAADFPDVPDFPSELAAIQSNLGINLKRLGEPDEARAVYEKAITALGKVIIRFPTVPEHRHWLGTLQSNLGNVLAELNRPEDSERAHRDAAETMQALTDAFPGVPSYREELARVLFNLGAFLAARGNYPAAEEAYGRALVVRQGLVDGDPGNAGYRAALASTCNNLALVLVWQQGPPWPGAERAVELATQAVKLEPESGRRWRTLGWAQFRTGRWQASLTALECGQKLDQGYGADHFFQAMAAWKLGRRDEARRYYDLAAGWLAKQQNPNQPVLRVRDETAELLGLEPK